MILEGTSIGLTTESRKNSGFRAEIKKTLSLMRGKMCLFA